jgi:hypothetical protein
VLWSHNDHGDAARLIACRSDGSLVAVVKIVGAGADDWEDIALGPSADGNDALFIGDIGDNSENRPSIYVYQVAEPDLTTPVDQVSGVTAIELVYGDGKAHNAEALLVDPRDGSIVIITKVPSGESEIYTVAPPFSAVAKNTLKKAGTVVVGGAPFPGSPLVTGASITRAGDLVLLRTYSSVLGWPRAADQSIADALAAPPCPLPAAIEKHGESVALVADGSGFYTVGGGALPPLSFSKRR